MLKKLASAEGSRVSDNYLDSMLSDSGELDARELNKSNTAYMIADRFEITSNMLRDFSTDFADAFEVVDKSSTTTETLYYALAFKSAIPIRINEIINLKKCAPPKMIYPIEYGITEIDEVERFVAILPRLEMKSLRSVISENIRFDWNYISQNFLPPLLKAIQTLHQANVVHGSINPDTIFLDPAGEIILGECISAPSGYYQNAFFETLDRAQCNPIGKGNGVITDDYYSLGMTIYYTISARDFTQLESNEIIREKLYQGTFHFLNAAFLLSGNIADLLRGLSSDQQATRWGYADVENIVQGRRYNTSNLVDISYLSRAVIFNGKEHYSRKSLAFDLYQNWDAAKEFIKTEKIKKWLEISTAEEKYLEAFSTILVSISSIKSNTQKIVSIEDERLIKTIIALDPEGPIRFKNTAFSKNGLGIYLAYSLAFNQNDVTQILATLVFINVFYVFEIIATLFNNHELSSGVLAINKCSDHLRKADFGFGIERCLYELNPFYTCQSGLVNNKFIISLRDLLQELEAQKFNFEDLVSKKTIAAFIAAKIMLPSEVRNPELSKFPLVQRSRAYQILGILSLAQKQSKVSSLNNLCETLYKSVVDVLDVTMRSSSIKHRFFDKISLAAKSGNIIELQKVALSQKFINDDSDGYSNAVRRGAEIAREIFECTNSSVNTGKIYRTSLGYTLKFTYALCALIITVIIANNL